eukprot:Selendium_serpulae@DN6223_c2_g1_i1.p1
MGCLCTCVATTFCCGKMRSCCYCFGLAVGAFIFSCAWIINGIYQICIGALATDSFGSPDEDWWLVTAGSISVVIGLGGLVACFLKMGCGAMVMFYCYAFSFCLTIVSIIIRAWC